MHFRVDGDLSIAASCLRYRDAPKAIEWLCRTFGFEKQLVVPNA
ncbi:MAG: VOC family protein, partial [Acidimicrobiia bacterium]